MKMVTLYDLERKQTHTIPAAELAPGMVHVDVRGVGLVWIDGTKSKLGDVKHPPLSSETKAMIRREIMTPLRDVFSESLAEWEDGFRRDENPDREIALWCRIVPCFQSFAEIEALDRLQRQECFRVMIACTLAPRAEVLEIVTLTTVTEAQAKRAIEAFLGPA